MARIVQYCSSYESMLDHVKALNSKTLQGVYTYPSPCNNCGILHCYNYINAGSSDFAVICNKRFASVINTIFDAHSITMTNSAWVYVINV